MSSSEASSRLNVRRLPVAELRVLFLYELQLVCRGYPATSLLVKLLARLARSTGQSATTYTTVAV